MAFSSELGNGPAQVTLIDVKSRVMCVYHVDRATGQIELKSVRNVHWDLLMEEFNGVRSFTARDSRTAGTAIDAITLCGAHCDVVRQ